jgi:hypothetical protein
MAQQAKGRGKKKVIPIGGSNDEMGHGIASNRSQHISCFG